MINIANAPCSWGVDYADDPNNPNWKDVFEEISKSILSTIFISSPLKITFFDKFLAFIIIK